MASALLGIVVRRDAESRAETAKRIKAYDQHASTIADQIASTGRVIEQERIRLEPLLDKSEGYPKRCSSGQSHGTGGWKYELKIAGPTTALADVVAAANIVDGELAPITITSDGSHEGKRVVDRLIEVYTENSWKYNVITRSTDVETVLPTQRDITTR